MATVAVARTMARLRTFAAAIIVATLALVMGGPTGTEPPAPSKTDGANANDGAVPVQAALANERPLRTEPADTIPAPEPWLAHPYTFELRITASTRDELPSSGCAVRLGLPRGTSFTTDVTTGGDGIAVARWRSRRPEGTVIVTDTRGALHRVTVRDGTTTDFAMIGPPTGRECRGWISFGTGTVYPIPRVVLDSCLHPFAAFVNQTALAPHRHLLSGAPRPPGIQFPPPLPASVIFGVEGAPTITGVVLDGSGVPMSNADVALLDRSPQPMARTTTDEAGQFTFEAPGAGTFTVHSHAPGRGVGCTTIDTETGLRTADVRLQCTSLACGRVVGANGAACDVEWRAVDDSSTRTTSIRGDGPFVFANLPRLPGRLLVWTADVGFPIAVAHGDAAEVEIAPHASKLILQLARDDDTVHTPIEVRAWQKDSEVGSFAMRTDDETWSFARMPRGWYRIEAVAAGNGFVDLGTHWVDGEHDVDLGRVVMPKPARVRLEIADASACELYEVRDDADVFVLVCEAASEPMLLPAGEYALAFRHRDGDVRFVRFTVRSGEETLVTAPE